MPDDIIAALASMRRIADRAALADIEQMGTRIDRAGRVYDVRQMLDEREHAAEVVDMAAETLAYALMRKLVEHMEGEPTWLVRIVPRHQPGASA